MLFPKPRLFFYGLSFTLLLLGIILFGQNGYAQGTRILRTPTVSKDAIAFVHANDIWVVSRKGGNAWRLTSAAGAETDPHFSPDGKYIAFTAQYTGNTDIYVVPSAGGQPKRLTWHPGRDTAMGWMPDGVNVLFQSGREGHPTASSKFFAVSVTGGFPKALPIPRAYDGRISEDGFFIAYQEVGFWDPEWRNYRGGQAQPISVVSSSDLQRITPPWEGERQMNPSWLDGVVYYISERDFAANVWSWNPTTKEEKQRTFHTDFDVKSLGTGGGVVIYEQGGYLHELNPNTGKILQLEITVAADQDWVRPRWEDVPAARLRDARLSPTGKRALFEYRGDLFTVPAEKGSWRNITRSPGVADRHAVWSPDGMSIAWFNDEGGEYGLIVADQDGSNPRRINIPIPSFFFVPTWSPDGTHLAFTDTHYRVLIVELESGKVTHADTDRYAHPERTMNPVWSPDSRWIAYSRRLDNQFRAVFVYNIQTGEKHQLTDGMADAISPVWDASGKYLYILASTDYGLNTGWLDMTSYDHPVTRALYIAILKKDTPSPFLPASDEEKSGDEKPEDKAGGKPAEKKPSTPDVIIDFDGLSKRILSAAGLSLGDYIGLIEAPEGQVFVAVAGTGRGGFNLLRYTIKDKKQETFLEGVSTAITSNDRKKLLFRSGSNWAISDTSGGPPKAGADRLNLTGMRYFVEPRAEYAQMLRDGWRFMRDFLYVDNTHGAPWDKVWTWYEPWLKGINHRSDFNYLLDILSGEIAVGHSYVSGGDYPDLDNPQTGLLGADIEETDGFYRITRIYTGEDWNPGLLGPLAVPGLNVKEGDYLLKIDGRDLRAPTNPFMLLEGTAGRTIKLTVNAKPSPDGARDIFVEPVSSEGQLRSWAWVAKNQKLVDEMSEGKLAYVYVPNTGQGGYTYFNRMYFAQQDRKGAIIDERNNGGGSAADYIVDILGRTLTGYFNSRAGDKKPFTQPMAGLWGPKVMIINERSGSGGDLLPYLFRFKKIGPLVGTRTWGGLVGTWDTPPLIDGGRFVAPRGGFINTDGQWAVEAEGVAPDIEIRNDPKPVMDGHDPQLEAAVKEAIRLLETEGVELKPEPPAPIRWKRPIKK
ncbi:MAG: PDZ domain-containing protein [Candidatus Aminicenantes bacterium]|nr:PDZ domain-containing protein [Candidatus Aminicenantes bacterium]